MRIEFGDYLIRDWYDGDAPVIARYADNRKIWLNLRDVFPHPYKLSDAKTYILKVNALKPKTIFAIASQQEAIGSIGLVLGSDVHRFSAELGYWLAEPFWNKGIMTEAICKFTDFAFKQYKLYRIFAEPYIYNHASARVLEKCRFICEGIMKNYAFKDGKILDMYLYAKTQNDLTNNNA
jgi:RimJ/RimL family protein N-acetyltransferase